MKKETKPKREQISVRAGVATQVLKKAQLKYLKLEKIKYSYSDLIIKFVK